MVTINLHGAGHRTCKNIQSAFVGYGLMLEHSVSASELCKLLGVEHNPLFLHINIIEHLIIIYFVITYFTIIYFIVIYFIMINCIVI